MGEQINVQAGNETVAGYLAVPAVGTGPGVLVLHAWWGLTESFTAVCDQLAAAGFVAVAPDLHAGKTATTIEEAEALISEPSSARGVAALAGLDYLREHSARTGQQMGIIGFSMGAAWALELASARPDEVAAAVLFYGAGEADYTAAKADYLGHFSEDDPWEPFEWVREMENAMRAAGRTVRLHTYPGVGHWFFESNRPEYDPAAAALAWDRTIAFLRQQLVEEPYKRQSTSKSSARTS